MNENGLRELKEDPGSLQIKQKRPFEFQGKEAKTGANGQYPVGTTGHDVVELPFVVKRAENEWKIEPQPYFALMEQ